jgi:hypothetical protein
MELTNATPLLAGYTLGVEPSGRELLVVVMKGTFGLPASTEDPVLLEEQQPLVMADTFTGQPGFSAPYEEVDFAPRKHRCDVLLTGSAWAPNGQPAERVTVGIRVGAWKKVFSVTGDRQWICGITGIRWSAPTPFVRKAISYDVAFGGTDVVHEDPAEHKAFMRNPVGRGWHHHLKSKYLDGTPLPNTEELDRPVVAPDGDYTPMSFGPLGRGWSSRLPYAGTYDQQWIDNTYPFLPADFRDEYYQAAPLDQQIAYPAGGEEVTLLNLTASGREIFRLPTIDMPVSFFRRDGEHDDARASLDTLVFQPDKGFFTMTWRATLPLKRNIFEISEVLVGAMPPGWWRARELGKTYYPSLAELALKIKSDEDDDEDLE